MHHIGMLSDDIGRWNTLNYPYKLEVEHNGHGLYPVILVYFGHIEVVCLFLFQLTLMLVL